MNTTPAPADKPHPVQCECGYTGTPQDWPSTATQMLTRHRATRAHERRMTTLQDSGIPCTDCDFIAAEPRGLTGHRTAAHTPNGGLGITIDPPGPWVNDALCAQIDPDLFHPEGKGTNSHDYAAARKICTACPVRRDCLDYALTIPAHHDHGIWGGTTPKERAALRDERNTAA